MFKCTIFAVLIQILMSFPGSDFCPIFYLMFEFVSCKTTRWIFSWSLYDYDNGIGFNRSPMYKLRMNYDVANILFQSDDVPTNNRCRHREDLLLVRPLQRILPKMRVNSNRKQYCCKMNVFVSFANSQNALKILMTVVFLTNLLKQYFDAINCKLRNW